VNGKKAKQIRKLARKKGAYSEKASYTKTLVSNKTYYLNGEIHKIPCYRIENKSKIEYRRLKRKYKDGNLSL